MSPTTSALPESSAPLAMRTRSRMPNVSISGDLPVHSRRTHNSVTPSPAPTTSVATTKRGPPIGQKKSMQHIVPAVVGSMSTSDQQHGDGPVNIRVSGVANVSFAAPHPTNAPAVPSSPGDGFQSYTDRLNKGDPWKRHLHALDKERDSQRLSHSELGDMKLEFTSLLNRGHDKIDEQEMRQLGEHRMQTRVEVPRVVKPVVEDDGVGHNVDEHNQDELNVDNIMPSPSHTDESPPSGSDYEAGREVKMRQREFYRKRGRSVSDTEEEEREEEERLEEELASERGERQRHTKLRFTAEQKGKGKAKPVEVEGDIDEEDDSEDDEQGNVHGPLPKAAMKEAADLGKQTRKSAEVIAKKYGKAVRNVMIHAGLGIKNARQGNFSNLWKVWYSHHHPCAQGMEFPDYRDEIYREYRMFKKSLPPRNTPGYHEARQPIIDFCDQLDDDRNAPEDTLKSVVARMFAAKNQFTGLAASYYNLNDILVIGAVLYTGTDPGARQASTLFGGNDIVKDLISKHKTDVRKLLDQLTTTVKAAEMNKDGGLLPLPSLINPVFNGHHAPRDRDRHFLGRFLVARLREILGEHSNNFPWQRWCDFAALFGLCIYNWDSTIIAPGPDFDIRSLKSDELRRLVERINWDSNPLYISGPELDIRPWVQPETGILIEEQGAGGIAVVMDGMQILRKVEDGKAFHKKVKKDKGKAKVKPSRNSRSHRNVSSEDDESEDSDSHIPLANVKQTKSKTISRPIVPLPSRIRSSTYDSRPSKRKRQELSDHENDIENIPKPSSSHITRDRGQSVMPSRAQAVVDTNNISSDHPVIEPAALPIPHYSRQSSHAPSHALPSRHQHTSRITHSMALSHSPVSRHSLQSSQALTRSHASQLNHRAARIMVPSHHVSHRHHAASTSRAPYHRQLTPVFEDYDYHAAETSHHRAAPQGQFHRSANHEQPAFHLRQFPPTDDGQSTSRIHQYRSEEIQPVYYSSRYYPEDNRSMEGYNRYDNGDVMHDPQSADYGDNNFYGT